MTYKRIIKFLTVSFSILLLNQAVLLAQVVPGKDCSNALRLCTTSDRNDTLSEADPVNIGFNDLAGGDSVCWPNGEIRPFWYKFTAANSGPLEMSLAPYVDFAGIPTGFLFPIDWSLYDVTNGCSVGPATTIACRNNTTTDSTGFLSSAPNPNFLAPVNLIAGRTYALVVDLGAPATGFFDTYITMKFNLNGLAGAVQFQDITADFDFSDDTACVSQVVTFLDLSTGGDPPYNYTWDFGDGSPISNAAVPTHSYAANGTYPVSLTVDNGNGCSGTVIKNIVIRDIDVTFSPVADLCPNDPPVTLIGIPAGGTFTGAGVTGNTFDPSIGTGSYPILYTFTDPNGCSNTDSKTINVLTPVSLSVDKTSETLCNGIGSAIFTASGATNYQWFELGNPAVLSTNAIFNVSPPLTTQYAVRGRNAAGCDDFDTVTVFVNANPTISISPSGNPICLGDATNLTASGADTYQWFEQGNAVAIASTAATTVSPTLTTNYFVIGTTTLTGCFDTAFITITVDPLPVVAANADINPICPGGTSNLTASGADTYQWFETGNAAPIAIVANVSVNPSVATTYFVVGTNTVTGCFDTAFITINLNAAVVVNITATNDTICQGDNTNLTASGADTYQWFIVGNATSIGATSVINVSPAVSTDYIAVGTSTLTGCIDSAFFTLVVNPIPTVSAVASTNPICDGTSSILTASGANTYQWFEQGNPVIIANTAAVTVSPTLTTNYFVVGTVTSGCFDTAFITITVNPLPSIIASADVNPICPGATSNLTGSGANTYQWFEQGNAIPIALLANVAVSPLVSTNYFVIGTNTATGCFDTAFITVTVNPAPIVSISAVNDTICQGDNTTLTASGAETYQWFIVGNATTIGTSAAISVSPIASTDYIAVGTSTLTGCIDSAFFTLVVSPIPSILASPSANPICNGNSSILTASGANTYEWFEQGNPVSIANTVATTVSPTITSNYFVIGTATSGCFDTAFITITVNPLPIVLASADANPICIGSSSNLSGSGANTYLWFEVGNVASIGNTTTINVTPAVNTDYFVVGTNTLNSCFDTAFISLLVVPSITPTVALTFNPDTTCSGDTTFFSTAVTGSGSSPTFQWFVNDLVQAGFSGNTYFNTSLLNGDEVKVELTSSEPCASTTALDSVNPVIINSIVPVVSLSQSPTPICFGDTATIIATSSDGGSSPVFGWTLNGSPLVGENNDSLVRDNFANGDLISVQMISSNACAINPAIGNFNAIVNPIVNPSISVVQSPSPSCIGDTANFIASFTGGGLTPVFSWTVNGTPQAGFNGAIFFSTSLSNGDIVDVTLISSETCSSGPVSANASANISSNISPSVSIAQTPNPTCTGDTATFNAIPVGQGSSPLYQWRVNTVVQAGVTGPIFESDLLSNGDLVEVLLTSSASCATGTANANFTANITNIVAPAVSLIQTPAFACSGINVDIVASQSGGGTPVFAWTINGTPQAINTSVLSSSSFTNGDLISVVMTSSLSCAIPSTASSNISVSIGPALNPSVSLSQVPSSICNGDSARFNAIPTFGGISPSYNWFVNGIAQAITGDFLAGNTFVNGDEIVVELVSSEVCATGSDFDTVFVNSVASLATAVDSVVFNPAPICNSNSLGFKGYASGQGVSPVYSWQLNGVNLGVNSDTINVSGLSNGDTITFSVASSSTCASPSLASLQTIVSNVFSVNPLINVIPPSACGGSNGIIDVLSINGGSGSYQILINGFDSLTTQFSGLGSGAYLIDINDIITGCTYDTTIVISVPGAITASVSTTPTLCGGLNNGQAQFLSLSGGSGFYEMSLDTGISWQNSTIFTSLAPGNYLGIVRDSLDPACTFQLNFFIGSSFNVSAIIQIDKESSCGSNDAIINILSVSGGNAPYQFILLDSIGDTLEPIQAISSSVDSLSPGNYTLIIIDNIGCELSIPITINGLIPPSATPVELQSVSCFGGNDGTLSLTNSQGGTGVFLYSIDGGALQGDSVFNSVSGGTHILSIQDVNTLCSSNYTVVQSQADSIQAFISISPPSDCSTNNGVITVDSVQGGNNPFNFSLNGSSPQTNPVFSGLGSGLFNLIVRDNNSCSDTNQLIIVIPGAGTPNISTQSIDCFGDTTGVLTVSNVVGGTAPFLFSLDNISFLSDTSFTGLSAGPGVLFMQDGANCLTSTPYTVNQNSEIQANVSSTPISDCNLTDGSISISNLIGGQPTYTILVNGTNQVYSPPTTTFNNLDNGIYTIQITDILNCVVEFTDTILAPNNVIIDSFSFENPICFGASNGQIEILGISGGSTPYSFQINGQNAPSGIFTGLLGDSIYTITVTDNDNCDVNFDVTLSQPDSLSFDINQTSAADCGENTGSVLVINPLGGNGIYTYEIIGQGGPQTSTLFDSLASGNYTMLMLDGNNCQNSSTFTINGTSILNYTVASNSISCFAENDGSISLGNLNGGFAPFSLSLDNGATFSNATFRNDTTISNLLSGDYDIVIRDSINCTYSFPNTISITEPDPIDAEVENITMTDVDSATGRLAIYNIIGGSSPYEVSLDGSAFFSVSLNPLTQTFDTVIEKLAVGFITVFIRDNNACLQDFEAFIEEYEFANRFTIPNIFTPNKDGFNDNFVIPKLPTGSKIKIFEKSGRPVYENDDYQNDWDGEEFVDGTYFYILDVPNQGIYRGFIEIFR